MLRADLHPNLSCLNGLNKEQKMIKITAAAPAADQGAISHLFNNLDLIITNQDKILSNESYRNINIKGIFVGGLYVGMHEMSLGDILYLWNKTQWHEDSRYYYNIIGTPLSGMNTAYWYDTTSKQIKSGTYYDGHLSFIGLAKPALSYMSNRPSNNIKSNLSIFDLVHQLQR